MAEKPTKYFLNLEKSRYNKKTILRLKSKEGKIVNEEKDIQRELSDFYKKLYTAPKDERRDTQKYLNKYKFPELSSDQKDSLEQEISLYELGSTVKELKNSKTLGVDGIPVDFYKIFWEKLKHFFLGLIKQILEKGKFHLSARRGIITLLEKVGKSPLEIMNWHPITLLCTDFKILDKVIARCLQKIIPKLIHKSQTGFQKGKQIGENIMKLLTLVEYCEKNDVSAIIFSVDFYKAFNTINWRAITEILTKYNFGDKFCSVIKTINNEYLMHCNEQW